MIDKHQFEIFKPAEAVGGEPILLKTYERARSVDRYLQSPFRRDVCWVRVTAPGAPRGPRLEFTAAEWLDRKMSHIYIKIGRAIRNQRYQARLIRQLEVEARGDKDFA